MHFNVSYANFLNLFTFGDKTHNYYTYRQDNNSLYDTV